jgi:hypothetical protein
MFKSFYAKLTKQNRVAPLPASLTIQEETAQRIAFVYMQGVNSTAPDSCLIHAFDDRVFKYNQVSYNSRGVLKDYLELRKNIGSLNSARGSPNRKMLQLMYTYTNKAKKHSGILKTRLVNLIKTIQAAVQDHRHYDKVYCVGVSHGSILMYQALMCLRSKNVPLSDRLYLYTIGSPYALYNKGIVGGVDNDAQNPRILHIYNSNDILYGSLIRALNPGFRVPTFLSPKSRTDAMAYVYDPENRTCITHFTYEQLLTALRTNLKGSITIPGKENGVFHSNLLLLYVRFSFNTAHRLVVYLQNIYKKTATDLITYGIESKDRIVDCASPQNRYKT